MFVGPRVIGSELGLRVGVGGATVTNDGFRRTARRGVRMIRRDGCGVVDRSILWVGSVWLALVGWDSMFGENVR